MPPEPYGEQTAYTWSLLTDELGRLKHQAASLASLMSELNDRLLGSEPEQVGGGIEHGSIQGTVQAIKGSVDKATRRAERIMKAL